MALKPFLKYPGGKGKLLNFLAQFTPKNYTTYYECFVGGGSNFLFLQPELATINDINSEIINCYKMVRDKPKKLIELCQIHKAKHNKEYYYLIRSLDRHEYFSGLLPVIRAARFLYLNKTCYNGLVRFNKNMQFNSPIGAYKDPTIIEPDLIRSISKYLNKPGIKIEQGDFAASIEDAPSGSFIYLDPPYRPISTSSNFVGYSKQGFQDSDQIRIKQVCDRLIDRGVQILISNSASDFIYKLYNDSKYEIVEIEASRSINSNSQKRGKIKELLIYSKYEITTRENL